MADPYLLNVSTLPDGPFTATGWARSAGTGEAVVQAGDLITVNNDGAVYDYDLGSGSDVGVWLWTQKIINDVPSLYLQSSGGFSSRVQIFPDVTNSRFRLYTNGFTNVPTVTPLVLGALWECRVEMTGNDQFKFFARPAGGGFWDVTLDNVPLLAGSGTKLGIFLAGGAIRRLEYNPDPAYEPTSDVTAPTVWYVVNGEEAPGGAQHYYSPVTITLNYYDVSAVTAEFNLDGAGWTSYLHGDLIPVSSLGPHTVLLRATDSEGNSTGTVNPPGFTLEEVVVAPAYDLPEPPSSGDVWGQDLNDAIRTLHLGPGVHGALPAPGDAVERALFVCTTHDMVHINVDGAWIDYFPFPS